MPTNNNLQIDQTFFPSKTLLRKKFEGELWTILKSPTLNPFHENIFTQFIESNTADAITIIHRLRKLILKEQHQQIKIGYVSYKSIPLAAWRFLYGKPYPAENFTWQELFDMVYERFTKKGSLIKFLVIFQDATSKNFTNDKWALRILWTYHAIVRYHALNHPEECLEAIDQNLIHEAGFAKIVRREIKRRKKNISLSLAPTITTLATNISSDPLIEEETPTVFEGVLAKDETSLLDHQKTSVIKQDPLIINLAYFSDSESEDEWPIMEFANNEDLDFPAGHSDFLHEYVRLFLSSPPNKPIAGQYFAGLFGDFVSPTKIMAFLKFHEEYLHLDAVFQKSYDCIDALLTQRNQLLTMLESCSPKLAA